MKTHIINDDKSKKFSVFKIIKLGTKLCSSEHNQWTCGFCKKNTYTSGKGITATMGRNGFFNMIYFGFYHSTKQYIPASTDPKLGIL